MGVSRQYIYGIEGGTVNFSFKQIDKMAEILEVDPKEFFNFEEAGEGDEQAGHDFPRLAIREKAAEHSYTTLEELADSLIKFYGPDRAARLAILLFNRLGNSCNADFKKK